MAKSGKNIGDEASSISQLDELLKDAGYYGTDDNASRNRKEAYEAFILKKTKTGTVAEDKKEGSGMLSFIASLGEAAEAGQYFTTSINDQLIGVGDIVDKLFEKTTEGGLALKKLTDENGNTKNINLVEAAFGSMGEGLISYQKQASFLQEQINTKTSLTGFLSADYRDELERAQPALARLGVSTGELASVASKLVEDSGRFNLINRTTFERAAEVGGAFVGSLEGIVGMYPEFEKIGIGAADANERISDAGKSTLSLGLNAKKIIGELSSNLNKINEYGFKNGVEGLARMQQKATEFRINMSEVFKIADKVMNPEGAIELAANLQVLGGAIGDFNDPMKLMHMATNDAEGLQDALINAAGGLAKFNEQTGKFEIKGENLRRTKEMASLMGVQYDQLANGAIAAAERAAASTQLMSRGLDLKPEQREFLTNIAQMKDGKMQIELQSDALKQAFGGKERIKLEELTQAQVEKLLLYQKELKESKENDILKNQYTSLENIKRAANELVYMARLQLGKAAEGGSQLALNALGITKEQITDASTGGIQVLTKAIEGFGTHVDKFLSENGIDAKKAKQENREARVKELEERNTKEKTENAVVQKSEVTLYIQSSVNVDSEWRKDVFGKVAKGEYTENPTGK